MKKGKALGIILVFVLLTSIFGSMAVVGCSPEEAPSPDTAKPAEEAKTYELKFGSCDTAGSADYKWLLVDFADRVREATDGRIDITTYPGGELMPAGEMLDGVSTGTLDGFASWTVYFMGKDAGLEYWTEWPYGINYSYVDMLIWMYERGGVKLYRDFYASYGIHHIKDYSHGGEVLMSTFPANRLADLDGKKMRSTSIAGRVFAEMGVAVTVIAAPELYTALQRGTIDLLEYTTLATDIGMGLHEVAPYVVMPAHSRAVTYSLVVSQDVWGDLSPDLRSDINGSAAAGEIDFMWKQKAFEMEVLADPDKYGITFITWPDEDHQTMAEASMRVWEAGKGKSEFGDKIIASKLAFAEEVAATYPYVTAK